MTNEEAIYKALAMLLRSGEIEPGAQLVQRELAKRLNTTTTPLREALARLEMEGLVERESGFRGLRLKRITAKDAKEHGIIRRAIESEAVILCCENAEDAELKAIYEIGKKCDDSLSSNMEKAADIDSLDYQFHLAILRCGRSSSLEKEFERINITNMFTHIIQERKQHEILLENHTEIAEKMIARDQVAAVKAMRKHIDRVTDENVAYLKEKEMNERLQPFASNIS